MTYTPILQSLTIKVFTPWQLFQIFLIGLLSTFITWYLQYYWKNQKLYKMASMFPGPLALPFVGSALRFVGDAEHIFNVIIQIFNEHSGIQRVWLGNRLFFVVAEADYLEKIMIKALNKTDLYKYSYEMGGTGLFLANGLLWKLHRKIIQPTFNQKILNRFVEVFVEKNFLLINQLKLIVNNGEFDIFSVISQSTLDIICETAMGAKVDVQTNAKDFGKWIDRGLEIMFLRMFVIWYHFDFIFNRTKLYQDQIDIVAKIQKFTGDIVREKREAYEKKIQNKDYQENDKFERKAFLDLLIELSADGAKFTDEEMRDEVKTFIVAGSDTTASSICFILTMLAMHPNIQNMVYNEIIDVLGDERDITYEDLPKLKLTERCIKETLRLFPVGAIIVRAIDEDLQLDEKYTLPAGSSTVLGIFVIHRDPRHWPNPLKFDPDRFLPENTIGRHPYAYVAFSGGPRNCIGTRYAMMAMKTMIANLIRSYHFNTTYKSINDIKLKMNLLLRPIDGFKISIKARNSNII